MSMAWRPPRKIWFFEFASALPGLLIAAICFFGGFQTSPLRAWNDDNQPFVVVLVSSGSHFEFVSLLFFQNKLKSLNSSKSIAIWETLYLGQRSQLLGVWYAYSFCFWQVQRPALEVFLYIYISISFYISIRYTVLFLLQHITCSKWPQQIHKKTLRCEEISSPGPPKIPPKSSDWCPCLASCVAAEYRFKNRLKTGLRQFWVFVYTVFFGSTVKDRP